MSMTSSSRTVTIVTVSAATEKLPAAVAVPTFRLLRSCSALRVRAAVTGRRSALRTAGPLCAYAQLLGALRYAQPVRSARMRSC
jgi:hypothetical protein